MPITAASRTPGFSGSAGGGGTNAPASSSSSDSASGTPATVRCSGGPMSETSGSNGQEPTGIGASESSASSPPGSGGAPPPASRDGGRATWGNGSSVPSRSSVVTDTPFWGLTDGHVIGD